jgi:hypothetical protein
MSEARLLAANARECTRKIPGNDIIIWEDHPACERHIIRLAPVYPRVFRLEITFF